MHDLLLEHQNELDPKDLIRYAVNLGLDVKSFTEDLRNHRWSEHVAADIESADVSGGLKSHPYAVRSWGRSEAPT